MQIETDALPQDSVNSGSSEDIQPHSILINSFSRAVLSLLGGGIFAQLLPYIATVFLARLFSPAEYGYLALFTSMASALAIVATGRYELAVLLPEKETDAAALVFLSMILALGASAVFGVLLFLLSLTPFFFHAPLIFWFTLPAAIFIIAVYQALTQWFLRQGLYNHISGARFVQAAMTVAISMVLGWCGYMSGLIMGYTLGWMVGVIFLIAFSVRAGQLSKRPTTKLMKANAVRFSDHAVFGAIPALLSGLSIFALIFIITHHYGSDYAGQYSLSMQLAYGPISLVVSAIGQVVFRESSRLTLQKKCDKALFLTVTRYLSYPALLYIVVLIVCAPAIFSNFFNSTWQLSGRIVAILAVSYGVRLIANTLSSFLLAHNALRINGAWQVGYFIITCLLYFFNPKNPMLFFLCFMVVDVLLYGIYFFLIRWVVYKKYVV